MRRKILISAVASLIIACLALPQACAAQRGSGEDYWIDLLNATEKALLGTIYWDGSMTVWAGAYKVEIRDYTGIATPNDPTGFTPKSSRQTWVVCIDKVTLADPDWYKRVLGQVPSPNVPGLTQEKWAKKVWLVNTFGYGAVWNGTKDTACGLQLAIWEVLTDDTPNLSEGNGKFYVPSGNFASALPYAQQYLNALLSSGVDWSTYDISNDVCYVNGQNLNEVPIPEPFTLVLASLGIGAVAGLRRLTAR